MQKIIVADTSCLILYYKIGEIELLRKLFGNILITETVAKEFNSPIPPWIHIKNPVSNLQRVLQEKLDPGEATSISLAAELEESLLIIDESKGRKMARTLGLTITGSLGILVAAKKRGIITHVKPILEKITQTNFRITEELIIKILHQTQED